MIGMQYIISLPSDYDMNIIKNRIRDNGNKTDGFKDLLFKCYLIQERGIDGFENVYAPLYIWRDSMGMNKFIFEGYFDNIIKSFGWQKINIGVPLSLDIKENFAEAKYVIEFKGTISPRMSLEHFADTIALPVEDEHNIVGNVCIYNPDKWKYSSFIFCKNRPSLQGDNLYQIKHISMGD